MAGVFRMFSITNALYEFDRNHRTALPFICDGQRLKDAIMGYNIANIIDTCNATVVVLIGAAHATKAAVPRMLQKHREDDYAVILPKKIRKVIRLKLDDRVGDYIYY